MFTIHRLGPDSCDGIVSSLLHAVPGGYLVADACARALEKGAAMNALHVDTRLILLLAPLALIDLIMIVYSIVDLYNPERRVRGGNKLIWLVVILLVSTFGWLIYLLAGREEA